MPEALLHVDADGVLWCNTHDPDPIWQERRALGRQRGQVTSKIRLGKRLQRLDPGELGPLQTVDDAQRQLSLLAEAVATGRLSSADANAASRLITGWIRARDLGVREQRLARMEAEIERLKALRG